MSKIDLSNVSLSGFDDIFNNNTDEVPAVKVPISELYEFKNHPFRVVDEDLAELIASIKDNGVLEPAIVRTRKKGGYELISGHRRKRACELSGITEMPVRVMDYTDDDATIIMVDSNIHREVILPSEKAKSYAMRYNAVKHRGKAGGNTLENLSELLGESAKTIQRYIQLSRLNNGLMSLVDANLIPFSAGVEVSFLTLEQQGWLLDCINDNHVSKVSLTQAGAIRNKAKELGKDFAISNIIEILVPQRVEKPKVFKFKQNRVADYFPPETSSEEIEKTIYELLEKWKANRS